MRTMRGAQVIMWGSRRDMLKRLLALAAASGALGSVPADAGSLFPQDTPGSTGRLFLGAAAPPPLLAARTTTSWFVTGRSFGPVGGAAPAGNAGSLFGALRWGGRSAFATTGAGAGGLLLGLVPNGSFSAAGLDFGNRTRLVLGVAATEERPAWTGPAADLSARAIGFSYTFQPAAGLSVSFTNAYLDERHRLLGSSLDGTASPVSSARSASVGAGFNLALGNGFQLGFDAAVARTGATRDTNGLFLSPAFTTTAVSIALSKENLLDPQDSLDVFIKQPGLMALGTGGISIPQTADPGAQLMKSLRKSIVPTGRETNIGFGYSRPLTDGIDGKINLNYRTNADNIAGAKDTTAMFHLRARF